MEDHERPLPDQRTISRRPFATWSVGGSTCWTGRGGTGGADRFTFSRSSEVTGRTSRKLRKRKRSQRLVPPWRSGVVRYTRVFALE